MKNIQNQQLILSTISHIPYGKVTTYGSIAKRAGLPGYARQVGAILKTLPEKTNLPWHRVINAQGRISFPENSPQHTTQKQKLLAEGIVFSSTSKINLHLYLW